MHVVHYIGAGANARSLRSIPPQKIVDYPLGTQGNICVKLALTRVENPVLWKGNVGVCIVAIW
ncbi:hypothetical protein HETIRDRAFT_422788 [Heterobasidion irregulare TC 32-1]|uniref:Uncharacterized protein n=1 Tax=Heterobasidion irregulare (strain TC 32-1) TaxID=747525 RepID=W4JRM5_HETIT|nr:uncharacterized protein HETIRDRAFT_422788 [Heterobasidion irregulare TC 32-1]ETW76227.1 hypothetical protein HETIRDRAFT_422788 [Heterobasidion irregulare TC 32-1]